MNYVNMDSVAEGGYRGVIIMLLVCIFIGGLIATIFYLFI